MKTYSNFTHSFASRSQSDWSGRSLGNRIVPGFRRACLWLALLTPLFLFFLLASSASAQGALSNGANQAGTISPAGDMDTWTFSATAGNGIMLRVGATNFVPEIQLYGPDSALVGDAFTFNTGNRDAELYVTATNGGPYTVVVSSGFPAGTGTYGLILAQAPGTFVTSPGDEGGTLANGVANPGTIKLGDLDMWSFSANAGDGIVLRMGATNFVPQIRLYGPDGVLVGDANTFNTGNRDAQLLVQATNSGTYTVVVGSYFLGGSGTYGLTLAQSPGTFVTSAGDQGGALANGVSNPGTIDLGDLDMWSFAANAGDNLVLRMGATGFVPEIRLFGPAGALVGDANTFNTGNRDAQLPVQATNAGTYTVVVGSYFLGGSGTYTLTLAQAPETFVTSPGDEGGTLTNGVVMPGTIDLGDLDMWSFGANAGDGIVLRMGATNFVPEILLFGPDGALVGDANTFNTGNRDALLLAQATNSGIYTVVVDSYFLGGSGTYGLTLAKSPGDFVTSAGDEGSPLINGFTHSGTNSLGDLDMWSFYGTPGDSNVLQVATVGFTPHLQLFGPDGTLVRDVFVFNTGNRSVTLTYMVTNAGPYTAIVSSYFLGGSGTYTLRYSRVPPDLNVPDTQSIAELTPLNVSISAQDPDVPLKALLFTLVSAPANVIFTTGDRTNATISWATTEADGPSTNLIVATVTDKVNGHDFIRTNSFTVIIQEINTPPQLSVPADQSIDELTPLITVKASATDADLPPNPLTFSLVTPPTGMTIDPASGVIAWTPTEAQGPSTNTITVVVTDDSPSAANAQHLSTTNSFNVVVREINTPPQFTGPGNLAVDELKPLNIPLGYVADADLPANALTYSLITPPGGMTIISGTGAINWTPTEAQGPSTNLITVVVTDNSPDAVNAKQLSATNTFTVVVNDVNSAPVLPAQTNRTIEELTTLTVTNTATDLDLPANTLTYALVGAPTNATIGVDGVITWTPTEAQGPSTNIFTTVVSDNGSPPLSATNSFTVVVNEVNIAPVLPTQNNLIIDELTILTVTNTATDADLPANTLTYALLGAPTNAAISANGVITWTPSEAQGPSTNAFTTVVTDNGNPSASATNTFTVVVNELNSAPVLQPIGEQTVHFGNLLSLQAVATDADLPSNTLTFSLDLAPTNLTINATNGSIAWTPEQLQVGVHPVTIRVTDNGSPSLSATNTFQVTVTGTGSRLDISLASGSVQLTITGDSGHDYELQKSADLVTWDKLIGFPLSGAPFLYIDPDSKTTALRFYRLKLIQ